MGSSELVGQQSASQTRKRDNLSQIDEHSHEDNLPEMRTQMYIEGDHKHTTFHENEALENDPGSCKANRQRENPEEENGES